MSLVPHLDMNLYVFSSLLLVLVAQWFIFTCFGCCLFYIRLWDKLSLKYCSKAVWAYRVLWALSFGTFLTWSSLEHLLTVICTLSSGQVDRPVTSGSNLKLTENA